MEDGGELYKEGDPIAAVTKEAEGVY